MVFRFESSSLSTRTGLCLWNTSVSLMNFTELEFEFDSDLYSVLDVEFLFDLSQEHSFRCLDKTL